MGAPAKSYHEQRQDKCLHLLEKIDPAKNEGFRYRCVKPDCGRFLKRKIGVVRLSGPTPDPERGKIMPEAQTEREVIRCPHCGLNQYMTRSGLCRKPECGKPLKGINGLAENVNGLTANSVHMEIAAALGIGPKRDSGYYRPEVPSTHPLAEAEKAIDTLKEILVSNVRRRKKPDMRYKRDSMLIRDVPADFRQKLIKYCKENKTTLRDLVVTSVQKELDRG